MMSYNIYLSLFDFTFSIISRSVHVAANGIISFFFMAEWYSIVPHLLYPFIH